LNIRAFAQRTPLLAYEAAVAILADRRYTRAGLTTLATGASSAMSMIANFAVLPMILGQLGGTGFGVWMTLFSFTTALSFLDLGVGLGLLNALTECNSRDDREGARRSVTNSLAVVATVSLAVVAAFLTAYAYLPWGKIFNIGAPLVPETRAGATVLLVCIAVAMPASLATRIQAAHQQGYISALWDIVARALIIVCVFVAVRRDAGGPLLLAFVVGLPIATTLANGVFLLAFQYPWLRPRPSMISPRAMGQALSKGSLFVVLQIVTAVAFASDNLIISHVLTPAAVTAYAVTRTLFQFISTGTLLMLMPLWPAYGEAIARKEWTWVARTLRWSLGATALVSALIASVIALFGHTLLAIWIHRPLPADPSLLAGFAVFTVVTTVGNALAVVLNAASVIRFQVFTAIAMGLAAVAAKVTFGRQFGLAGVIWGTDAAYLLFSLAPTLIYARAWLRRSAADRPPAAQSVAG
jgi:O-antigen/teichoic acid export membrane protein